MMGFTICQKQAPLGEGQVDFAGHPFLVEFGQGKQGTDHGFTGSVRRTTLWSPVLAFAVAVRIPRGGARLPSMSLARRGMESDWV